MPKPGVGRPLGESDLRDQLRTNPVRPFVRLREILERALVRFERLQQLHYTREFFLVEAGAAVPDVDEIAPLVHAEQQRAEIRSCVPWFGPSADHELLLANELHLPP